MPAIARQIVAAPGALATRRRRRVRIGAWLAAACAGVAGAAGHAPAVPAPMPAPAPRLVVVGSGEGRMFMEGIAGIRQAGGATVESALLGRDDARIAALGHARDPNLAIIAVGNRAAEAVGALESTRPVVQCMVSSDANPAHPAAERITVAVPAATQAEWLRKLLPQARTIALLYTPGVTEDQATSIAAALSAQGFVAVIEPVTAPSDLPVALRRIAHADALLALPDPAIYSPELARGILLFSYRTRTPLVATMQSWVRAGALYGFEWRYGELGSYCASLALARLSPPGTATAPPTPRVLVNRGVAKQLGIEWDAAALAGTESVQ